MSEAESGTEKRCAATLTAGALEYFHRASEAHMQRVVLDGNTIAIKVRSKAAGGTASGPPRVQQSRGDPSTLEAFLASVAADAERGCLVSEFDSISNVVTKQFTRPGGFARVSEVFFVYFTIM